MAPDVPPTRFEASLPGAEYTKQEVMIPMRDGVKLRPLLKAAAGGRPAGGQPVRLDQRHRCPQTFVPNIFFAKPGDYQKATQRIFHAPGLESAIELPVVK